MSTEISRGVARRSGELPDDDVAGRRGRRRFGLDGVAVEQIEIVARYGEGDVVVEAAGRCTVMRNGTSRPARATWA
jgi:hypothetical protein